MQINTKEFYLMYEHLFRNFEIEIPLNSEPLVNDKNLLDFVASKLNLKIGMQTPRMADTDFLFISHKSWKLELTLQPNINNPLSLFQQAIIYALGNTPTMIIATSSEIIETKFNDEYNHYLRKLAKNGFEIVSNYSDHGSMYIGNTNVNESNFISYMFEKEANVNFGNIYPFQYTHQFSKEYQRIKLIKTNISDDIIDGYIKIVDTELAKKFGQTVKQIVETMNMFLMVKKLRIDLYKNQFNHNTVIYSSGNMIVNIHNYDKVIGEIHTKLEKQYNYTGLNKFLKKSFYEI